MVALIFLQSSKMQKAIQACAFSTVLFVGTAVAQAQYSTNFDPGSGYATNYLTNGQTTTGGTGQNGWLTSDPENDSAGSATEFVGGSNYVGSANIGSPAFTNFSGYAASLGGNIRNQSGYIVVPGAAVSTVYHPFTLAPGVGQGYQFDVDFVMSVAQGSTALTDSFAFSLRNSSNAPLLTINFTPSMTTGRADIGYAVGGNTNTLTGNGVTLNGSYHLTIQVNPVTDTYKASYSGSGVSLGIASGSLSGSGILPNAVTEAAAVWTLKNQTPDAVGGYSGASTDALLFDNYAVTYYNLVPEPSTYAVLAVGLLALAGTNKLRRRA